MNVKKELGNGMLFPAFFLVALIGFFPFYNALAGSFFFESYTERSFSGFANYSELFSDRAFFYSLNITVLYAFIISFFGSLGGFILACSLYLRKRLFKVLYPALLVPWVVPIFISVPLWRMLIHGDGGASIFSFLTGLELNLFTDPVAGFLVMAIVALWLSVPLTTFVMLGALRKIPRSVLESASLEGASEALRASHIIFPLVKNSFMVMMVLNFVSSFKEFTLPFLLTDGGPSLISGITRRFIIGATTTLELFLFDLFRFEANLGVTFAYAVVLSLLVYLVMILWFFARSDVTPIRGLRLFLPLVLILSSGLPGIAWGLIYALYLGKRNRFALVLVGHAAVTLFMIASRGFLEGFDPGITVAAVAFLILKPDGISGNHSWSMQRSMLLQPLYNVLWPFFTAVLVLFFILSSAGLVYGVFWLSFSAVNTAFVDTIIPPYRTLAHYADIFVKEGIHRYLFNTMQVAAATALLVVPVVFPAAARIQEFRERRAHRMMTFFQIMGIAGGIHALIPLYMLFRSLSLLNSYIPVVLIYVFHQLTFGIFTVKGYLSGMPRSLKESALIEGAGPLQYLFRILFPLSMPALITVQMTAFLGAWNGFLVPLLLLNDDAKYTIGIKIHSYIGTVGSASPRWGLFAATSIINASIILFLFLKVKKPLQHTSFLEDHQE
jgi:multiple sugar transport system permease protein